MKKTNASTKSSELNSVLSSHFQGKINLARIKLISHFIIALCKVQTVTFEKVANAFETSVDSKSSLRRIQRFIADYSLDGDLIARLIFSLLPKQEGLILSIDRTNWKFGQTNINIFMLGVVYKGVAFPLLFTMLDKPGNSNSQERIDLVNRFIRLFGKDVIKSIVADREFVGNHWLDFLNTNGIKYYIRIRNNFKVELPDKNKTIKVFHLFNPHKINEFVYYPKIVRVNGQLCFLSGCKLYPKNGKPDFLIIVSFNAPDKAFEQYKERWQIEMCFKAMKASGFHCFKTHTCKILSVLKNLVLFVMMAFVWCYKVGIYLHQIKPIKIKKHGRMAKSIFKYGLDYIASVLLNPVNQNNMNLTKFLSCT
ncbi:MAG: IS4 family transposase [Flavobacteriaceae bacterium]|nr:MAG: IS4 family transposase [Flavobacteriaceae bacterium]